MQTGMLWFDNDPKTALDAKLEQAVDYYRQKYGVLPNFCLVHPGMLAQFGVGEVVMGSMTIREYKPVLPGHLWIGIEEKGGA